MCCVVLSEVQLWFWPLSATSAVMESWLFPPKTLVMMPGNLNQIPFYFNHASQCISIWEKNVAFLERNFAAYMHHKHKNVKRARHNSAYPSFFSNFRCRCGYRCWIFRIELTKLMAINFYDICSINFLLIYSWPTSMNNRADMITTYLPFFLLPKSAYFDGIHH